MHKQSLLCIFIQRPGAIVKKITFKKGIDISRKIIIIISVKGKEVEWTEDGSEKLFQKRRNFPLTKSEKSDTI